MDSRDMYRPSPTPPWNEVLRACAAGELNQSAFGIRLRLTTDRHEPRTVGLVLSSGRRSIDLDPMYVCICGAFALGKRGAVAIDDVSTANGATRFVDLLVIAMRQVRPELVKAADP